MIVWLNGTFGAGKTTTSTHLVSELPDVTVFDSEIVGQMLGHLIGDSHPVANFQQWPPWRTLVVQTARSLLDYVGGTLVIPQTVLDQAYWDEIRDGFATAGIPLHHFVLHTDPETLRHRIEHDRRDPGARQWRLNHVQRYSDAFGWLAKEGEVVETTNRSPEQVASTIRSHLAVVARPAR